MKERFKAIIAIALCVVGLVAVAAGHEESPWTVGEGVTASTNGTELVIGGAGVVTSIAEIPSETKGGLASITIAASTVTGAGNETFNGLEDIALTLPDGWQGELPDQDGNWYGATGVNLTAYPLSIRNVKTTTHWPWNGLVDVTFDLTGAGVVNVAALVTTNDVKVVETPTVAGETSVDLGEGGELKNLKLVWNAAKDLPVDFRANDIKIKVKAKNLPPAGQLWEGGPIWAEYNVGAFAVNEYGWTFWWGDTIGATHNGNNWVSVVGGTSFMFVGQSVPTQGVDFSGLAQWLDASGNLSSANDAATVKLGAPWRLPTRTEFDALTNTAYCTSVWTDNYNNSGVAGRIVTGVTEGYTGNSIFLPAAGRGSDSRLLGRDNNKEGVYWSSTPHPTSNTQAWYLDITAEKFTSESGFYRCDGCSVRAVMDPPPVITAESDALTLDLRSSVALAAGEPLIADVCYSDTAWGAAAQTDVTVGYENLTTGATGELATDLTGFGATDVTLPKKDGAYRLTHSTGGLTSFVEFTVSGYPLGGESNPWELGENTAADVVAFTNGTDTVFFKPARGVVSKSGLTTVAGTTDGLTFKLVSADGTETNDLVMVQGASGTFYDTIKDALAADEASYTLFDIAGITYLDWDDVNKKMTNAMCVVFETVTNEMSVFEAGQTYVVLEDVTISSRIVVKGTPENPTRLILGNGTLLTASCGVDVSEGCALVVCGQSDEVATMGALTATANAGDAALGGSTDFPGGHITINGGNVTVTGGSRAAGIGGGLGADGAAVAINGGRLSASGGALAPAIGGGVDATGAGSLVFAADAGFVVKAGADETSAVYLPSVAYADDYSASYVLIESGKNLVTLKIPESTVGFSYVVTNMTREAGVVGACTVGTNDYVFVANDEYRVIYSLDVGYEWEAEPAANPLTGAITADTELPDVSVKLQTFPLEIPVAPAGLVCVVSNETAEIVGTSTGDVNTYTVTYGDTVTVYFSLADGYRYIEDPGSPLVFENVTDAVKLDEAVLPVIGLTWAVGITEPEDVEAYVDPAFTDFAAVVIDNGLPATMNGINLAALASGIETSGYEPAVRPFNAFVKIEQDGETEYLMPTDWIGENGTYATLEDAIKAGETAVVPDFATEMVPVRVAEKGKGADGKTHTAVVENNPAAVEKPLQVRCAQGLLELALESTTNIKLVATTLEEGDIDAADVADLAAANTNGVVDVVGYQADYVDLAVYFGGEQQHVLDEILEVHIPRPLNSRNLYRVSRVNEGVVEPLPIGADNAADGEYVEFATDEIILHVKKSSIYALGEIMLQPRYGIVVGNGGKIQGEPDPSNLATNFTVNVQGLDIDPADIRGYCVRAKGEAAGDYVINFVCTSIPQDYDGEFVVTPGVFTITAPEVPFAATGEVTLPKTAKNSEFLKANANATWKANPDMGCVFAGWVAAPDASETVTNLLAAAGEAKCAKATLSLKIPAGAEVKPEDVVATWKRLDEDVPEGQVAVMIWCDQSMGSVSGTGLYKLGKDGTKRVSVKATAKNGFVFAGWYLDPDFSQPAAFVVGTGANAKSKDYRETSQTITVTANTYLFARFVEKTTKTDSITWLRFEGAGYCGADASWLAEEETWYQGVSLPTNGCQVAFGSASLPTVTVSGLPAGVKFDKTTLRFTGIPTVASTEKKPFFTVKVSVKNKSGATDVLVRNIRVEPLPAWIVGNFDGYHFANGVTNGTLTATIGKTGKVSGKVIGLIAPTTISAKGFSNVFIAESGALVYTADVTVQYRDAVAKKNVQEVAPIFVTENPETGLGMMVGEDEIDGCTCVQRAWERKDLVFPAFATGKNALTLDLDNGLILTFGKGGAVTVSGTVAGDDGSLVSVSCSAYVLPLAWRSTMKPNLVAQIFVYVPPKKNLAKGVVALYDLLLEGSESKAEIANVEILPPVTPIDL